MIDETTGRVVTEPDHANQLRGQVREILGSVPELIEDALVDPARQDAVVEMLDALGATWARALGLLDRIGDAFVTMDHGGRIIDWNTAATDLFGWSYEQATGRMVHELLVPEHLRGPHEAGLRRFLVTGEGPLIGRQVEVDALRADGTTMPIELRVDAERQGDEWVFTAILRDISERRQAEADRAQMEQELRASEERFRSLATMAPIGIYECDEVGRVVYMNPRITQITGRYLVDDRLTDLVAISVHPDDRAGATADLLGALREGREANRLVRLVAEDGDIRWVRVRAMPRVDGTGRILGLVGALEDISDLVETTDELQRSNAELRVAREEADRASQAKSEFLSRMSHELRTPLNSIIGFAQILGYSPLGADDAEAAGLILESGRHLLSLIDEVLDIARIESGELGLGVAPVSLAAVTRSAVDGLRPQTEERAVTVTVDDPSIAGVAVVADPQRLTQVLLNLLSNAIKYNHHGGRVDLSASAAPGDRVALSVRDTGPGIPPELLGRVFEPFDRLGAERTDVPGVGIGLSLSKALVEQMQGTLTVASPADGGGAVFTVTLPGVA